MSQKLSGGRRIFSEPQAAQYFHPDRLEKMTGRKSGDWHRVVVKELMDNALDAAESAGRVPVVGVAMDVDPSLIRLSVQDNGVGIPADVIERMLDFSVFASDKAVYRTPTRGQQGNALKTIVGMPHAMGLVDRPPQLSISAFGIQHRIKAQLDGAGHPHIDLQQEPSKRPGPGSTVEVLLPTKSLAWMKGPPMLCVDVGHLLWGYHLFNPHARVTFSAFALGIDHMVSPEGRQRRKLQKLTFRLTRSTGSSCLMTRLWSIGLTSRASPVLSVVTSAKATTSP